MTEEDEFAVMTEADVAKLPPIRKLRYQSWKRERAYRQGEVFFAWYFLLCLIVAVICFFAFPI